MTWEELRDKWYEVPENSSFEEDTSAFFVDKVNQETYDRMFEYAWREFHAFGFHEVLGCMQDLYYVVTGNVLC